MPGINLQFVGKGGESAYSVEKTWYRHNSGGSTVKTLSHWQLLASISDLQG